MKAGGFTCYFCPYQSKTAQGIRAHARFCPNRHGQAVPASGTGTRAYASLAIVPRLMPAIVPPGERPVVSQIQAEREKFELRRLQEANRALDAKREHRDQAELD